MARKEIQQSGQTSYLDDKQLFTIMYGSKMNHYCSVLQQFTDPECYTY
jgi:hypothetical protein